MMRYPSDALWQEIAYLAYHLHWPLDELLDLEPVLRDAVVLALPQNPLCGPDCPGLCPECGARLADDPDHTHGEAIDPRWSALSQLAEQPVPPADQSESDIASDNSKE